jgi:Na+-driven multidrug efflux pump
VQWFLWLLAWRGDPGGAALLVALSNIVAIANPVIFGVENVLMPEVARSREHLTFAGLLRLIGHRGLLGGGLIAPLFLLILIFPERAARLFYGAATPYADHAAELRLLVAAYVCILAAFIFSAVLRGYQASGAVFRMQLYPALVGLTLGSWLTWEHGVAGACLSALLAGLVRAGVGFHAVLRLPVVPAPALAVP